jgi:hypothetical protein
MKFLRRIASGVMPSLRAAASTSRSITYGRFRAARAAIGVDRHGVGEHSADAAVEGLDIVEPGQHAGAAMRNVGPEGREIGAHVAHQVDVHP